MDELVMPNPKNVTIIRDGKWKDWKYINHLLNEESNALGFVPKNTYESILKNEYIGGRYRYKYSDILITEDNGDKTGFCYLTYCREYCHVYQIAIQEDARRWYRATLLLNEIEKRAKKRKNIGIRCRVAIDLESNYFWVASGFTPIQQITSSSYNRGLSKSGRQLFIYQKCFNPLFSNNNTDLLITLPLLSRQLAGLSELQGGINDLA